jgi:hypothetical protein
MTDSEKIEMLEMKVRNLELEVEVLKLQKNQIIYPVYLVNPYIQPNDSSGPWYRPNVIWR